MRIAAFDLSLTETGYAIGIDGKVTDCGVISGAGKEIARMVDVKNRVVSVIRENKIKFVVFEDIPYATNLPYAKENAGLNFAIRMELFYSVAFVMVSPLGLKKFTTGSGKSSVTKEEVSAALKSPPFGDSKCGWRAVENGNVTDAIGLVFFGMALAGDWAIMTEAQREALETVRKNSGPVLRGV